MVALSEHPGPIDRNHIVRKHVAFSGSWAWSDDDLRQALDMVAAGTVDRKPFTQHVYPLSEAPEAFRVQERGEAVKILVKP